MDSRCREYNDFKGSCLDLYGTNEHPKKMAQEIVGAFQTGVDAIVVVNDLQGLVAVNLSNRGSAVQGLFNVATEGAFAAVLMWMQEPNFGNGGNVFIGIAVSGFWLTTSAWWM